MSINKRGDIMARLSDNQKLLLGKRIKFIRQSKNLDQKEFGEKIKPTAAASNVSRWERGLSVPNSERINSIASLADISTNFLLHGTQMNKKDIDNFYKQISSKTNLDKRALQKNKEISIEYEMAINTTKKLLNKEPHKIFKDSFLDELTPEEISLANQVSILFSRISDSELSTAFLKDLSIYLGGITHLIAGNTSKIEFSEYQTVFIDSINKNFK